MCSIQWLGGGQLNLAFGPVNASVKPRSNLVNLGQSWSNLSKLREMCSGPRLEVPLIWWVLFGSDRLGQTWSNLLKLREMCSRPRLKALLMWWVPVGSDRLGSGCLVLRADSRENPGGKNRVMTGHTYYYFIFSF